MVNYNKSKSLGVKPERVRELVKVIELQSEKMVLFKNQVRQNRKE